MSVTERLFRPLLRQPARPLITHYDDAAGTRVELSRATVANWAAKTANWLREEWDIEPGATIAVRLPAHWQTLGVVLGAWWCGARITDQTADAEMAFVPPHSTAPGARTVAVVALDPLGRGLSTPPTDGALNYLADIRSHGDDFQPWAPTPGNAPAMQEYTVDDVISAARDRAAKQGINIGARVLSTLDWTIPDGLLSGPLAVLAADASIVQCDTQNPAKLADRASAERTTTHIG